MERLLITITIMLVTFMANAQSCPDNNHPHAIDLGLPSGTKWACCNVGATTPEGYGTYYAWGETEEKEIYDWTTYIHCDGSMETCHDLGSDIAGTEYDVAHVQWGGAWIMPSQDQFQELISKCSCTWTIKNGVNGDLFTGPSGGSIFLPESDFWRNSRINKIVPDSIDDSLKRETDELPSAGYYWASTFSPSRSDIACSLLFSYGFAYWDSYNYRSYGLTVRPVISGSETNNIIHSISSTEKTGQAIYIISGIIVTETTANFNTVPPGIYIVKGRKRVTRGR